MCPETRRGRVQWATLAIAFAGVFESGRHRSALVLYGLGGNGVLEAGGGPGYQRTCSSTTITAPLGSR